MSLKDRIQFIRRDVKPDARGWLLKVITGHEEHLPDKTGEMYIVHTLPGNIRGNHYHTDTSEWFSVFQGAAQVILEDIETKERMEFRLSDEDFTTVYVPYGIAHAFVVPPDADKPMILVAYADHLYDPAKTIAYKLQ